MSRSFSRKIFLAASVAMLSGAPVPEGTEPQPDPAKEGVSASNPSVLIKATDDPDIIYACGHPEGWKPVPVFHDVPQENRKSDIAPRPCAPDDYLFLMPRLLNIKALDTHCPPPSILAEFPNCPKPLMTLGDERYVIVDLSRVDWPEMKDRMLPDGNMIAGQDIIVSGRAVFVTTPPAPLHVRLSLPDKTNNPISGIEVIFPDLTLPPPMSTRRHTGRLSARP